MKKRSMLAIAAALVLGTGLAHADGIKDPVEARKSCEKQGKAGNAAELKKCCNNIILMANMSEQKRLVELCVKGKPDKK